MREQAAGRGVVRGPVRRGAASACARSSARAAGQGRQRRCLAWRDARARGACACAWAALRQVHARVWPGRRGEQAALPRAGKERGKEGEREGEKEKKKEKGKRKGEEKEKDEKRERKDRSLGGFRGGDRGRSRTRAGRAWRTGRGGTGRRDNGWISGLGFREIGRGMILNGLSSTIENGF